MDYITAVAADCGNQVGERAAAGKEPLVEGDSAGKESISSLLQQSWRGVVGRGCGANPSRRFWRFAKYRPTLMKTLGSVNADSPRERLCCPDRSAEGCKAKQRSLGRKLP